MPLDNLSSSQDEVHEFTFDETAPKRLDKYISQETEEWSRSQIQAWIKAGRILVNDKQVKANYQLQENDEIRIYIPAPQELEIKPEQLTLDIVHEDQDVIVINKPRGTVVHPAPGHLEGTLVNGLLAHCQDLSGINGVLRPGIVHRIDKDTSGLLMVAKHDAAHRSLADQLKAHTVTRQYIALVHGEISHEKGTIDAPIGRSQQDRKMMDVVPNGKNAVTHFEVLERYNHYTLVRCQLETGRTHQIRVHLKYIGFPLVGDPKYGTNNSVLSIEGQALHAAVLGFSHPRSGERLLFEAPLPSDFETLIGQLR